VRLRTPVALGGIILTAAAVSLWRRRARGPDPAVLLGLTDGAAAPLAGADPAVPELLELAAELRHHLERDG
jgi:hypothetical protein